MRMSRELSVLALCLSGAIALACGGPTGTPRPSPSLVELDFTPQPTATVRESASSAPTASRAPTWPDGWDTAFCTMLTDAVIAQELVVDIERALDEEALRDARGLSRELTATAIAASTSMEDIPDWDDGEELLSDIAALMTLDALIGEEYETYLRDDSRGALRRARNLRRENQAAVPGINTELESLANAGLSCPGVTLQLESP